MRKFFEFAALKTNYKKEMIGALSTFSAMVYIIIVHPSILANAGLPFGSIMSVTILITAFTTALMGILGKAPLAIAPALGVSGYFTFTLVLKNKMPVEQALFIVFLSGVIILALNIFDIRKKILKEIPEELVAGITGGIGLFLITIGFKQIELIKIGSHGFITLNSIDPSIGFMTLFGVLLIYALHKAQIEAAFILSILINWGIAIILGYATVKGFVALPPSIKPTFLLLSPPSYFSYDLFKGFLSIFLVTLFDSSAGLLTLKKALPAEARHFDMQKVLYPDAIGSTIGSFLGTSSLAIHLESLAGIHSGSKSGFTAIVVSILFIFCLFFYPLASSIPLFASAPVIISIGFLMARQLKDIFEFPEIKRIAPLLTAVTMPITLSLYQGFKIGFILTGLLTLFFPKKMERSKTVLLFMTLFILESLLELFKKGFLTN